MLVKSRAAVIVAQERVEMREIDMPAPKRGEVLVRQKAVALCTLEQRFFTGVFPRYPGCWGHEVSGIVEAIGPDTHTPLKVGDHVARGGGSACGECHECAVGQDSFCPAEKERLQKQQNTGRPDGIAGIFGMSEYASVDPHDLVKMSESIPFEEAALAEPIACAVNSADKLDIELGQTVVVIGAGAMGLANVLVARARGAFVVVSDLDPNRRAHALKAGAHAVLDPINDDIVEQLKAVNDGRGADVVIVAIGVKPANDDALRLLAPHGKMMLFASAHPAVPISIDPNFVHRSGIWITGSTSKNRKALYQAALLISRGIIDVKPMIEKVMPLDEAQQAFEEAIKADTYRIVITM
ncbi:MAG: zinc-binding dehydrogenase [Clostridia bacterium]|nr:zinc-binding dehydrogenase [Clostridia bacterium]